MEQYVYPNESRMVEDEGLPAELEQRLATKVKAQDFGRQIFRANGAVWASVLSARLCSTKSSAGR